MLDSELDKAKAQGQSVPEFTGRAVGLHRSLRLVQLHPGLTSLGGEPSAKDLQQVYDIFSSDPCTGATAVSRRSRFRPSSRRDVEAALADGASARADPRRGRRAQYILNPTTDCQSTENLSSPSCKDALGARPAGRADHSTLDHRPELHRWRGRGLRPIGERLASELRGGAVRARRSWRDGSATWIRPRRSRSSPASRQRSTRVTAPASRSTPRARSRWPRLPPAPDGPALDLPGDGQHHHRGRRRTVTRPRVHVIGLGPGGPDLVTAGALQLIARIRDDSSSGPNAIPRPR